MSDVLDRIEEKGIAIGYQQGYRKGKIETLTELVSEGLLSVEDAVTKMLEADYDPEMVASMTELPIEKVLELGGLVVYNTIDDTRTSDFFTVRYVRADDPERLARKEKSDRALPELKERLGFGK